MWAVMVAVGVGGIAALTWWRPTLLGTMPRPLVLAAAAGGAVVVALGDAAPTGWTPLDLVLRAAFGAVVTLAASCAGPISSGWLAAVAAAAGVVAEGWPSGVAGLALGVLLGAVAAGQRSPLVQALAAIAAVAAIAHLDPTIRSHLPTAAAAVATAPVLLVGLVRAPRRARRWTIGLVTVGILIGVVGVAAGAYAALEARTEVDRAVDAAVAGLDLIDGDQRDEAAVHLREAAASFAHAERDLRVWWARPALLVPGVAQHLRAVSTMASAGRDLSATAASAVLDADVDAVRPVAGVVDLAALGDLAAPLDRSVASLRRADARLAAVDSPLLVAPVADRLEDLTTRVREARASAETASAAVGVAPELLGAAGPRRYFVALQTPSELRGVGGYMGSWAELVIDEGRFDLTRTGRLRELNEGGADPDARKIEGHEEFVRRYGEAPARYQGVVAFSPDFPTVGSILAQLYPQSGGTQLDGVIALDPAAFASLLQLTGPVEVPGYPTPLTPENAEQTMLFEQYLAFPRERGADREQFLADATGVLFDALTGGDLPGPGAIASNLDDAVDGRHLQLFSTHEAEQRFFEDIGAAGSVRRQDGDAIGLVGQNFNGNKIDWFLRRSLTYDLTWDPGSGEVTGTVEARISNDAPRTGLPRSIISWGGDPELGQAPVADGENFMELSLFSALPLHDVVVDGRPVDHRQGRQLGMEETYLYLRVPSGSTSVVRAEVAARVDPGPEYVLRLLRQATVTPDEVDVRIALSPGWSISSLDGGKRDGRAAVARWTADAPRELRVVVASSGRRSILDRLRSR